MPNVSLTDFTSQQAANARQQKYAQLLAEESQQSIPIQSYNGTQAAIPWTAVLAKALSAYGAGHLAKTAADNEANIQKQQRQEAMDYMSGIQKTPDATYMSGSPNSFVSPPSTPGNIPNDDYAGAAAGQPIAQQQPQPQGPSPQAMAAALSQQGMAAPDDYAGAAGAQALGIPPSQMPQATPPAPPMGNDDYAAMAAAGPAPGGPSAPASPPGVPSLPPYAGPQTRSLADQQNMLMQGVMSGNPYVAKFAPQMYAANQDQIAHQQKLAQISAAIDQIPDSEMDADEKRKYKALLPVLGPDGLSSAIQAGIKPDKLTGDVAQWRAYNDTDEGKKAPLGFLQFEESLHPHPLNVGGNYLGDARNPGQPPGAPSSQINNPGNVKALPAGQMWPGQTGVDPRGFAIFGTPQAGQQASIQNLQAYGAKGINTPAAIAARWAPAGDGKNDPVAYAAGMAKTLGITPTTPLNLADPAVATRVAQAISVQEGTAGGQIKPLFSAPPKVTQGIWDKVDPAAKDAINQAVKEGRFDAMRLNSRNAAMIGDVLTANPGINLMNNHGIAQMLANPSFQNKALSLSVLPEVIQNVATAGKKINLSDVQFAGKVQAWLKGQVNDPDFVNYMQQRVDGMQSIASAMRQNGATDQSIKQEIEAAPVTMSPRAWDAWAAGQTTSMQPRQRAMSPLTIRTDGSVAINPSGPPAGGGGGGKTVVKTGTDKATGRKVVQYSDGSVAYAP